MLYHTIKLYSVLKSWSDDVTARRQLEALSDRLLADIGIERTGIAATLRTASRSAQPAPHYVGDLPSAAQRSAYLRAHLQPADRSYAV